MSRGGARPGAGRKPGAGKQVKSQLAARKVIFAGKTPLEFLLEVMRNDEHAFEHRFEAAKAAAPYVHPRLAAVEHSGEIQLNEHEARLRRLLDGVVEGMVEKSPEPAAEDHGEAIH